MISATTLATLLDTPPDPAAGVPSGHGSWRFVVEIIGPSNPGQLVGYAKVGSALVSVDEWVDITGYVRGCRWDRGSSFIGEAPDVGTADITLDSPDHMFAPWQTVDASFNGMGPRFRPPAVIRMGFVNGSSWKPRFCGVVESWQEFEEQDDADTYAEVVLVEPLSLAGLYDYSLITGGVEEPNSDRIGRMRLPDVLAEQRFPIIHLDGDDSLGSGNNGFGLVATGPVDFELSGTGLSVAQELCHSARAWITNDPQGRTIVVRQSPDIAEDLFGPDLHPETAIALDSATLPHDAASLIGDCENMLNEIVLIHPNSTTFNAGEQFTTRVDEITNSVRRYGRRSVEVSRIWTVSAPPFQDPQRYLATRAYTAHRMEPVEMYLDNNGDTILDAEPRSAFTLSHNPRTSPGGFTATGAVRRIETFVTALNTASIDCSAVLELDIYELERT